MAGPKNVYISIWWAAMLPTLRTTALNGPIFLGQIVKASLSEFQEIYSYVIVRQSKPLNMITRNVIIYMGHI